MNNALLIRQNIIQLSKNKRVKVVGTGSIKSYRLEEYSKECRYDDCPTWHTVYDTCNVNVFLRDVKMTNTKKQELMEA